MTGQTSIQPQKEQKGGRRKWLSYLLRYGVPLVVTVLLCRLLFSSVDWDQMMAIIHDQCDYTWIVLACVLSILSHVIRAARWNIQLRALGIRASMFTLTLSIFGTYAVNLVLPRLGELWRTGYIAKRQDAPFATVFGSMVADRLADTVTVALLTLATFLLATQQMDTYLGDNAATLQGLATFVKSPWLWAAIAVCVVGFVLFMCWKTQNKLVGKVQNFFKGLWQGFAVIGKMHGKGWWLLLTVALWGCYFMQLFVAFFAFPFTTQVVTDYGLLAVLVTFVLSSLAMGVPSNGGIGPWQWSVMIALTAFYAVGKQPALAFANLVMGAQTLTLILLGIFTFVCISLQKQKQKG